MRGRARRSLFLMMLVMLCGLVRALDGVSVVVVWPDVWGTYVAVDDVDTLGAVGTPDDPAGTYTWWKNSGPGNVYWEADPEQEIGYGMAPKFSADQRGIYTVEVEFELGGAKANDISGDIVVFEVCLGIDGVDDSEEEDPGGFVCEDGPRKKITLALLTMERTIPPGAMSLDPDGSNRIEIWTAQTGGQKRYPHEDFPYYRPVEWDCDGEPPHDEFPSELWVQGVGVSGAPRDVTMKLMYEISEENWWYEVLGTDVVKFTVVDVDLSATDLFGAVSEENEENPGAYVHYNIDNDNGNTSNGQPIADKDEDGPVTGENDLKGATMGLVPSSLEHGSVVLKRSNTKTRVWKSATKGSANKVVVDSNQKTWDLSNETQRSDFNSVKNSLHVEGYQNNGTSNLTFEYKDPNGDLVCSDTVKYTFIGAVCGRQPTPDERTELQFYNPTLVHCAWSITEPGFGEECDPTYNCIAWTVDDVNHWYDPVDSDPQHNVIGIDEEYATCPNGELDDEDLDNMYFELKEYTPTATGPEDAIVVYYSGFHAAKKKSCSCGAGKWIMFESKMADKQRIEHVHGQVTEYGDPERFYK